MCLFFRSRNFDVSVICIESSNRKSISNAIVAVAVAVTRVNVNVTGFTTNMFYVRSEKGARKSNLRHSQNFFAHLISCFLLLIFCSMTKINMQAFRNVLFLPARARMCCVCIVVLIYLFRSTCSFCCVFVLLRFALLCIAWSVVGLFVQDGCFLSSRFFSLMWHATNHFQWILLGTMRSLNV